MISGEGTKGFLIWFTGGEELIRLIRSEIIFYIRFRNLLKVSSIFPKAVIRRCYVKKVFWEFRKIHRKTGLQPSTLLEWGSDTGILLWIWQNSFFTEYLRRTYSVHRMNDQVCQVIKYFTIKYITWKHQKTLRWNFLANKVNASKRFFGGYFHIC